MQHSPNMFNTPPIISTEQIQLYLDENKQLIMAILENQNLGKLAECASYQAQLKQNLEYLTQIADAQPQVLAMLSQMPSVSAVQQEHYMQPSQPAMSRQQPGFFTPNLPFQLNDHQQLEQHQLLNIQQQHLFQGQMGMRSGAGGNSSSYQAIQTRLGSSFVNSWGSKQDCSGTSTGDGLRK